MEGVDLVDVGGAVDADGVGASVHADPFLTAEWSIGAARYEWSDEYGDLGPQIPELEEMLFSGTENAGQVGAHINSSVLPSLSILDFNADSYAVFSRLMLSLNQSTNSSHAALYVFCDQFLS